MHVITRSCVLFLWIQTLTLVKSQDCTLQDFLNSPLFDSNFNTTSLEESYANLKKLNVSCNEGYIGFLKLICVEGEWMSGGTRCTPEHCPPITVSENVLVIGDPVDSAVGDVLRFSCKSNAGLLNGEQEISCEANGQWSAPPPTCEDKCRVTGLSNSVTSRPQLQNNQKVRKGVRIQFYCSTGRRGDVLRGPSTVACLASGGWSDDFPTCGPPQGCGRPPFIENGDTTTSVRQQYSHHDRVEYTCQRFHKLEGPTFKTCNNGDWTGEMRCLKPCTVTSMLMEEHNIQFQWSPEQKLYAVHGGGLTFICKTGTRHVGTVDLRVYCHDGVMELPTCQ